MQWEQEGVYTRAHEECLKEVSSGQGRYNRGYLSSNIYKAVVNSDLLLMYTWEGQESVEVICSKMV